MVVDSDVIIVESSSERCGTHAPLPVIRCGMKNEAVFVDCSGVFSLFYEDEDIVGRRLIKLKSIGGGGGGGGGGRDQTCVKEPFSQDRGEATQGAAELWGGI